MMNWVFTWNNYTAEDMEYLRTLVDDGKCKYIAYAEEVAPTTGTKHLQGYMNLVKNQRMTFVKKLLPRCHIERMNGRMDQNEAYCSKQGQLIEHGTKPGNKTKPDGVAREQLITTMKEEKKWSKVP